MSHSIYIIILALTSVIGWISWFLVITRLDPQEITGAFPLVMFYSTLFLALLGTGSVISFYIRIWISRNEIYFEHLNHAMREGALIAITVILLLWLQFYRVLTIWDALLLSIAMILLDIFIISRKSGKQIL